jgi:hypothetical protein
LYFGTSGKSRSLPHHPIAASTVLPGGFKERVLGQKKVKRTAKWVRERFFLIAGRVVRFGFHFGSDRGILNTHCVMI